MSTRSLKVLEGSGFCNSCRIKSINAWSGAQKLKCCNAACFKLVARSDVMCVECGKHLKGLGGVGLNVSWYVAMLGWLWRQHMKCFDQEGSRLSTFLLKNSNQTNDLVQRCTNATKVKTRRTCERCCLQLCQMYQARSRARQEHLRWILAKPFYHSMIIAGFDVYDWLSTMMSYHCARIHGVLSNQYPVWK